MINAIHSPENDTLDSLTDSLHTEIQELVDFRSTSIQVQKTRKQFDNVFLVDFDLVG